MPADAPTAGAQPPPPPPPAVERSDSVSSSAAPSEYDLDRLHYANLPLGLASPTVIDYGTSGVGGAGAAAAGRKRYLCYFMHLHLEFRLPEIESLAEAVRRRRGGSVGGPPVVWERPFAKDRKSVV